MTRAATSSRGLRAFTLLELLVALTASTVLLGAMGSIFVLASRALPDNQVALTAGPAAARALDMICADVAYATSVSEGNATLLALTVPDRDRDGADEAIKYAWSGTPGDPLIRTVNDEAETLVANTRSFALVYDTSTTTRGSAGGGTTAEQTLLNLTSGFTSTASITPTYSIGQSFRLTLPAETTSWGVTRVGLRLSPNWPATGQVSLQLRTVESNGTPSSTVLAQTTINESTLTGSTVIYPLAAAGLTPGRTYCVMVMHANGSVAADARTRASASPPGGAFIASGALGLGWTTDTTKVLECTIYGTATTPLTTVSTASNLERVLISIKADSDTAPGVAGAARPLNRPGVGP